MLVKQVSIFLENKSGRLADVTKLLGDNGIDIRALSIADTTDFGILRLIVNKPEEAHSLLKKNNFTVNFTDVIAVAVNDNPGGLATMLDVLVRNKIDIEYMYAFVSRKEHEATVIVRVENPQLTVEALKNGNIKVFSSEMI